MNKQFIASETECEVCQRKVFAIDLEEICVSIFHVAWACDTCRQEIKYKFDEEFDISKQKELD